MTRLRTAGLSQTYRRNLRSAGVWLLGLVASLGRRLHRDDPPNIVDKWLERGVDEAYQQGERLYWVTLGVVSIQRSFHLSAPLLRGTWNAVKGWKSMLPPKSRVPITWYRLECMMVVGLSQAWANRGFLRRRWISAVLGWWLGFACLLRPGELLNLRVGDISLPEGTSQDEDSLGAVVIIRQPKTRRVWRQQFVVTRDTTLVQWLRWFVDGKSSGRSLLGLSRYQLADCFSRVVKQLHLGECHYTLGSLRAGGATHHFRIHRNLGELQYLGRWRQASTLEHYLHEAYAIHVTRQHASHVPRRLAEVHDFSHFLQRPPSRSLEALVREL